MAGAGINLAEKVKRITSDGFIKPHTCVHSVKLSWNGQGIEWSRIKIVPFFYFSERMINLVIFTGGERLNSQHPYMANPFDELWASSAAEALSGITPSNEAWFHGNISRKEAWFR